MNYRWKRLLRFLSFPSCSVQWIWSTHLALKIIITARTLIEIVLGVSRPDPEAYHSHASSARTGVSGIVAMFPPCLHGMHGTALPFSTITVKRKLLCSPMRRAEKNQLDVTVCFIAFMIRSTCFEHFYAYHQEHPPSWTHTRLPCAWPPTTKGQALHTIGGNSTHVV